MARKPRRLGIWLACLMWGGGAAGAWSAPTPTVPQMCSTRPRMEDVHCTTPAVEEQAQCKIEPVNYKGKNYGSILVDGRKQVLRRWLDTNGDGKFDVWCFYREGFEVYREIDANFNERPDQFRWFNDGGMKWGLDSNEDGRVDSWRMISAEEVGLEIFRAVAHNDFERLRALFINDGEMKALKLSQPQVDRIKDQLVKAPAKFKQTVASLKLDPRAQFVRVESAAPGCVPGDTLGMDTDLIRFLTRPILFESPLNGQEKKHDWIQSGEMIQVGLAWRLAEAPGDEISPTPDPALAKLLKDINDNDNEGPHIIAATKPAEVDRMLRRANLVEQVLARVRPEERESWIKQMLDNLGAAGYAAVDLPTDKNAAAAMARLAQHKNYLEKSLQPGSGLAGYATYRELSAYYLPRMAKPGAAIAKLQEEWHEKLAKFVQSYPNTDDTPDALQQLGIGSEFAGKEEEAKRWYAQIYTNFPTHALAEKCKGCVRRLNSIGQEFDLTGPTLNNVPFDVKQVRGKVVAVYYWATYVGNCQKEFAQLKAMQQALAGKVEFVCINLDDTQQDVNRFLQSNPLQAVHLFQAAKSGGGLNSPLAIQYGINGLPTIFVIGRDGKVLHRTLQVNDLEDALKKAL